VHQYVYTPTYGLVTHATTIYLNVPKASLGTVRDAINAITGIIVLDISDNDNGQGSADVTYKWRTKESAARDLGRIQSEAPSAYHMKRHNRVWIDLNVDSPSSLANAIAAALAGTGSYVKGANERIVSADGKDAGDKTAIITQQVLDSGGSYTPLNYAQLESINTHGLHEANILSIIREYPEVDGDIAGLVVLASSIWTWMKENSDVGDFLVNPLAYTGYPASDTTMHGRVQTSMNENGTIHVRCIKEGKPDWDNDTPLIDGFVADGRTNVGGIGESVSAIATGVPVAIMGATVNGAVATAGWGLTDVKGVEKGNGEAEVHRVQVKEDKVARSLRIISPVTQNGAERTTYETLWPLVLEANVTSGSNVWALAGNSFSEGSITGNYKLEYRQKQELGNGFWRITNVVVDTTARSFSFTSAKSDTTAVTTYKGWDYANTPATLVSSLSLGNNYSIDIDCNRYGKYDYVARKIVETAPVSAGSGYGWSTTGETYWLPHTYNTDGTLFQLLQYQRTYVHAITFHATAALAASSINGGYEGSGVSRIGEAVWMAHRITQSATQVGFINTTLSAY
jgi:hypothetical protein